MLLLLLLLAQLITLQPRTTTISPTIQLLLPHLLYRLYPLLLLQRAPTRTTPEKTPQAPLQPPTALLPLQLPAPLLCVLQIYHYIF